MAVSGLDATITPRCSEVNRQFISEHNLSVHFRPVTGVSFSSADVNNGGTSSISSIDASTSDNNAASANHNYARSSHTGPHSPDAATRIVQHLLSVIRTTPTWRMLFCNVDGGRCFYVESSAESQEHVSNLLLRSFRRLSVDAVSPKTRRRTTLKYFRHVYGRRSSMDFLTAKAAVHSSSLPASPEASK